MATILRIKSIFKLFLFLVTVSSIAQTTTYTFLSPELIPEKRIKEILYENLEVCFNNTDIKTNKMQQHIQFYVQNDSTKIRLVTSPRVITDVQVE